MTRIDTKFSLGSSQIDISYWLTSASVKMLLKDRTNE